VSFNARREYFLKLVNTRTKRPIDDDSGVYQVYNKNTPTRPSLYSAAGSALTQEVFVTGSAFLSQTMTDGKIRFFTDQSVSSVDISVQTVGGRSYFLKGVTPSQHRADVDPEKQEYMLTVAINDKGSVTTVRPLGFALKKGMILKDVIVHVTTAFSGATTASNTVDFGRSGDTDAFFNGILLQTTGIKLIDNSPQVVESTTGELISTKVGAALAAFEAGGGGTQNGYFFRRKYAPAATTNLTMRAVGARDATVTGATGKGYIYYIYDLIPSGQTSVI